MTPSLLGSRVTFLVRSPEGLLREEDADLRKVIQDEFQDQEHVSVKTGHRVFKLSKHDSGQIVVHSRNSQGVDSEDFCDEVLFATGRRPNVEELELATAGVSHDTRLGVLVDDYLRTTNPNIYAVGDVCSKMKFTHLSGKHAQVVIENALFGRKVKHTELVVPQVMYTSPEVARVGLSEKQAEKAGLAVDCYRTPLQHNDRAMTHSDTKGFVKIVCKRGTDKILGGTIVASCAGDLISQITMAIQFNIGLGNGGLGDVIYNYPSMSEAIAGCAFQYRQRHWETKLHLPEEDSLHLNASSRASVARATAAFAASGMVLFHLWRSRS